MRNWPKKHASFREFLKEWFSQRLANPRFHVPSFAKEEVERFRKDSVFWGVARAAGRSNAAPDGLVLNVHSVAFFVQFFSEDFAQFQKGIVRVVNRFGNGLTLYRDVGGWFQEQLTRHHGGDTKYGLSLDMSGEIDPRFGLSSASLSLHRISASTIVLIIRVTPNAHFASTFEQIVKENTPDSVRIESFGRMRSKFFLRSSTKPGTLAKQKQLDDLLLELNRGVTCLLRKYIR